jgi:aminoglycoside phosphotransferase (APT) family kinase protein
MRSSSTEKHLFEIERSDGRIVRAVLRRYPDVDRLAGDPWYEPANEAAALRILEPTPVPAPRLLALDDTGIACGAPALLESLVPGTAAWVLDDLEAYLVSAAERLVSIHAVAAAAASHLPAYAPYFADDPGPVRPVPRWTSRGSMWERVFSLFGSSWPAARVRFIHRDYHPGNALWDGSGGGVVDWATAARGPAGIDLARMRQNLAAHRGTGVADRFSLRYAAAGGDPTARDPFWDLLDAADSVADLLEPGAPGDGDGNVERFEAYVASVLAEL